MNGRRVTGTRRAAMVQAMSDTAAFVQFPHPGCEHRAAGDRIPGNSDKHRRKCLVAPGHYLTANQRRRTGEPVFWGEWESPARTDQRWPAVPRPEAAADASAPVLDRPGRSWPRQNTDTRVFGERMLHRNCKQTAGALRRPDSGAGPVGEFGDLFRVDFQWPVLRGHRIRRDRCPAVYSRPDHGTRPGRGFRRLCRTGVDGVGQGPNRNRGQLWPGAGPAVHPNICWR